MVTDLHAEKLALRVLCVGTPQGSVKNLLVPLLRGYSWQHPLHRVIFSAIVSIPSDDPGILQQLLPAKLTRMGFPDVEWDEIFSPPSLSRNEAMAVARQMLGA